VRARAGPARGVEGEDQPEFPVNQAGQRMPKLAGVDLGLLQSGIHAAMSTPKFRLQTQERQRFDPHAAAQHRVRDLEQDIRPGRERIIEGLARAAQIPQLAGQLPMRHTTTHGHRLS